MPATSEAQRRFFGTIVGYCHGKQPTYNECLTSEGHGLPQCHAWETYQKNVREGKEESFCFLAEEMAHY